MVSSLKDYVSTRPPLLVNVNKEFVEGFITYLTNDKKNNNTTVEKKSRCSSKYCVRRTNKDC